jgi:hypothetical protein
VGKVLLNNAGNADILDVLVTTFGGASLGANGVKSGGGRTL